jgi:WD40 repeat protein
MELWRCEVFGADPQRGHLWEHPDQRYITDFQVDPLGRYVLTNSMVNGEGYLIPLDGSPARALGGFHGPVGGVALSADARRAAVAAFDGWSFVEPPDQGVIRIWDLATGAVQILRSGGKLGFSGLRFLPSDRLLSSGKEGLLLWDLTAGTHEVLSTREHFSVGGLDAQGRHLVIDTPQGATLWDLEQRTERILPIPSDALYALAISPDARFVVAGMLDGEVWVLPLDSPQPHVLLGHEGGVSGVWITPESDRIYSAAQDGTVRIWEVPDFSRPPLHTLPRARLLATLRAQTNMRIVVDADAENGYRIEHDRFAGWETTPSW